MLKGSSKLIASSEIPIKKREIRATEGITAKKECVSTTLAFRSFRPSIIHKTMYALARWFQEFVYGSHKPKGRKRR